MAEFDDLPLSISPEYCKNWTKERAVSELVANAIDEARPFKFEWKDGVLVIEDEAHGLPRSSLVLGLSGKTDKQIGQFGEGLDIACLVLARTKTPMKVETVGYSFEPLIQHDARLGAEVLHIRFTPTNVKRKAGTKISVTCPEALADKVRSRFLQLSVPNYDGPAIPGSVLKDGKGGRVFIGGVLVQEGTGLILSYDLATESAKKLQNRDRSVIDARERRSLISEISKGIEDVETITKLVKGAMAGKGESEELDFAYKVTPQQRKALIEVRQKIFGNKLLAIIGTYGQELEANLLLKDFGYELVGDEKNNRLSYMIRAIYQAMDIPTAAAAAKSLGTIKRDGKKKSKREIEMETVWIKENALNKEEKSNFDWACALARGLFGEHAVGEVKVYLSTKLETAEEDVHCAGFFDPKGRGQIGLKRSILESRRDTFGTLGHEVGHAKRFRRYLSDWQDRSRGFEEELSDMIGALGEAIGEAGIDPTSLQASFQTKLEARDVYPGRRVRKGLVTPGTVTADLMKAAMKEAGYGSQRALAEAIYVKPSQVARVFKPSYTPPDYADLEAICDALGVNAAVVGLAKFVDYFQYYRKRAAERDKKVFPSGQQRRKMETLVSKLSESEIHAAAAQEVKGLMTGPFEPMSMDELQKPFLILLEQEKVRLAVEREAKTVGESHLVMS